MENLLNVLENNFTVERCGSYVNDLHQKVEHITVCDKAYSIRQQDVDLFEVFDTKTEQDPFNLDSEVTCRTLSNLSADGVVGYITEKSADYLQDRINHPMFGNHVVRL